MGKTFWQKMVAASVATFVASGTAMFGFGYGLSTITKTQVPKKVCEITCATYQGWHTETAIPWIVFALIPVISMAFVMGLVSLLMADES